MEITVREVEILLKGLLKKLNDDGFEKVEIEDNLHLKIPVPQCFEMESTKDELVGS